MWAAMGAGLFGLFMASVYPLGMSLLPSVGEYFCSRLNHAHAVPQANFNCLLQEICPERSDLFFRSKGYNSWKAPTDTILIPKQQLIQLLTTKMSKNRLICRGYLPTLPLLIYTCVYIR